MKTCPTCAYPLVWSDDRKTLWCSVYGTHTSHGSTCICSNCMTRRQQLRLAS